jgi:hypothetical protein
MDEQEDHGTNDFCLQSGVVGDAIEVPIVM